MPKITDARFLRVVNAYRDTLYALNAHRRFVASRDPSERYHFALAMIVCYGRPFTAGTGIGRLQDDYPDFPNYSDEEMNVRHHRLMAMRHRFMAHGTVDGIKIQVVPPDVPNPNTGQIVDSWSINIGNREFLAEAFVAWVKGAIEALNIFMQSEIKEILAVIGPKMCPDNKPAEVGADDEFYWDAPRRVTLPPGRPKRLYRYFWGQSALDALKAGALRIKKLSDLNDPFELRPGVRGIDPSRIDEALPVIDNFAGTLVRGFDSTMGVICFSTEIQEPVLWSHYADAHKGIALGFDVVVDDSLWGMTYSAERPFINANRFPDTQEEGLSLMRSILSTKAPSWEYESEYRIFIDLNGALVRKESDETRSWLSWPIPAGWLKHVVIGANSPISREKIERALKEGGLGDVTIAKARLSPAHFKVLS